MSGNREEILANFQSCTGIENVEEAIMWLENADWDLLNAIKNAIPQETQNQSNMLMYGNDEKRQKMNGVPVTISSDFVELPSTSDSQGILEIHVHYLNHVYKLQVPENMTVGCIKTIVYSDSGIPPCQQVISGWPSSNPNPSDDTVLQKLNMNKISHLYLESQRGPSEKNRVTEMDIVEESSEDWQPQGSVREADSEKKDRDKKKYEPGPSSTEHLDYTAVGRRSRSGRLAKRLKRDNSKLLFDIKIYDEVNHKEYSLKLSGNKTIGQVKKDAFTLTQIPIKQQVWCGWPGNVTDATKLSEMDLDQPFHCLILQTIGEGTANNSVTPNVCVERVPSPIFIDLANDTDSSPEDFEDASESFAVEDEMFNEEISPRNRITPLIPDNVEDETAGSVHFIDGYTLRYGQTSPSFFPGTLEDAIKEACFRPARERRMLAIYLHHDGSVLTNVFCTELLGSETVLQTFANYFVVWGWDITNRGNRDMFLSSVTRLLGSTVTETVQSISVDLLPALMIISRSRAQTELLNVIYGNIGINELLTMLIHAVDVFTDMQENEIKDEQERAAREQIKLEQDKAYQQSLQMDRAKEEAKKQQLLLQSQEEERLKQQQKNEEEKRQAERLAVESRLPDEPNEEAASSHIVTFRFRPPSGELFARRFLLSNQLQVVFDYLLVKGFRVEEYKVISPWPRRDTIIPKMIHLLALIIYQIAPLVFADICSEPLLSKCTCGLAEYVTKEQYIVNCTNVGFNDTKPLEKLPNNTQVLIFTGNNLPELPANVFGTENNNSHLRVVDLSNNKIKIIRGKAFHKVSTVERLILNHNDLAVDERHPRVFSNFESLLELHLTNAFADNSSRLDSHLHLVFIDSDLINLRKLHLEQNEIRSFKDPLVFCALNDLMDLHLGDNKLEHIRFKLDCLKHLRFLDLERNSIVYLTMDELSKLDEFPKRKQNLTIDLTDNPFSCSYQIQEFYSWLNMTSVEVRHKNKLKCKHDAKGVEEPLLLNAAGHSCHFQALESQAPVSSNGTVTILSLLLVASVALLLYTNMEAIKHKLLPIFLSLSRKVHYTTIGKNEAHEMEV